MSVFNRTPYFLHTSITRGGYIDEDGNKHKGCTEFRRYINCDLVPAGAAETKDFGDGIQVAYSYTIWIYDLRCRTIKVGERVKVEEYGKISDEFVVKGFQRYQTHCILWI